MKTLVEKLDRYMLTSREARDKVRAQLDASGVQYEMQETEEHAEGVNLYILAVKRISLTTKQRIGKFPRGD